MMNSRFVGLYLGTPAELALEPYIAALGVVYRTNFPLYLWGLGTCFPDFFLPTVGLVLEVDGPEHQEPARAAGDQERTRHLESLGYRVVRCTNQEAVSAPGVVVARLFRALSVAWGLGHETMSDWQRELDGLLPSWPLPRPSWRKRRRGRGRAAGKTPNARAAPVPVAKARAGRNGKPRARRPLQDSLAAPPPS